MTSDSQIRQHLLEGFHLQPFEIRNLVASGTWGDVYKARHRILDRDVALRIIHASAAGNWVPDTAKTMCRLRHPNIVSVHFADLIDDHVVIAMDYMEGRTLRDFLHKDGKLEVAEALRICSSVALALERAHTFSIEDLPSPLAHLGLRPSKIFLEQDGTVLVSGFGVVQATGSQGSSTGGCGGSPRYMAPEQFTGTPSYQSDQWAVGILLWEMLLGRTPYNADSLQELRSCICKEEIERVPECEQLPPPLRNIILRCLQRNPENRFPNTGMLVSALATVGAALGLPKCPACGADLPPGSEACFECALAALRKSYTDERGRPARRTRHDRASGGSYSLRVGVLFTAIAAAFCGFLFWQNWQRNLLQVQEAAGTLPAGPTQQSPEPAVREVSGNFRVGVNRMPPGEGVRASPAATSEWESILTLEASPRGSYEDRIAKFSKFLELYPGTPESIQAEARLGIWEAEARAFRDADEFERRAGSKICSILAKWQDFDSRQTTGFRRAYARERIEHWKRQVQDYIGYADLTIRSATGLQLADTNLFGSGKPDPYFELLEAGRVIYRSSTLDENSSPRWNEKTRIYIWRGLVLSLEIWDDNLIGRDLIVHQTLLPLPVDGPYQVRNGNILINLEIQRER